MFSVALTTEGTDSDKLTSGGVSETNLENGADEITPDLTPNKSYLIISTDDIADYDGVDEEADGRKVFYGLLDTATSNISALTDKPQNLVVNREISYCFQILKCESYSVTATLDILDSDLSAET